MSDLVSVLMCVYNTEEEFLKEAIDSILNQTYKNIEFIIIDDASDERTNNILNSYQDERIHIYRNDLNKGLTESLIYGLKKCNGKYIARMDSDDISEKDRIETQLKYIKDNKMAVVGAYYDFLPYKKYKAFITENLQKQKIRMMFSNSGIVHSSALIDKKIIQEKRITYNSLYKKSQDYGLWCSFLSANEKIGICPKKLVKWRTSPNQISVKHKAEQNNCTKLIRKNYIPKIIYISENDLNKFIEKINGSIGDSKDEIRNTSNLLIKIICENKNVMLLEEEFCLFWFIQIIKLIKEKKRIPIKIGMTKKCIKPKNFMYICKCLIKELKKM